MVTAELSHCGEDLLWIADPANRARIVIGVIEGRKSLRNELMRSPIYARTLPILRRDPAGRIRRSYSNARRYHW